MFFVVKLFDSRFTERAIRVHKGVFDRIFEYGQEVQGRVLRRHPRRQHVDNVVIRRCGLHINR